MYCSNFNSRGLASSFFCLPKTSCEDPGRTKKPQGVIAGKTVRAFNLGKQRFVANFNSKTGAFLGYRNAATNEYYKNPDIVKTQGDLSKTLNTLTFKISNTGEASSGQAIQTVQTTNPVSTAVYKQGNVSGFVDGGIHSPAFSKYHRENSDIPGMPYYIGHLGNDAVGSIYSSSGSVFVRMEDGPDVSFNRGSTTDFQTIIISTNFYGSGKDVIMGVYNWNASNPRSMMEAHNQTFIWSKISNESRAILKTDYPNYNITE